MFFIVVVVNFVAFLVAVAVAVAVAVTVGGAGGVDGGAAVWLLLAMCLGL